MSEELEPIVESERALPQVPPEETEAEERSAGAPAMTDLGDQESSDPLKANVPYLQLKIEELQGESSLLKEWGARIELYVDCLVDALETNHISHVYDVDGSLVSLDECRQKAKTLPHTRKPHCDEDLRTKQYEAEMEKLRQEISILKTDQEEVLQRNAEQEYLIEQFQTAEYQANRRWEVYHEDVMQQWSKCYSDLQGQYNDAVVRLQNLGEAFNNLKKSVAGRSQVAQYNRPDPFRRYRSAPVRRDVQPPANVPGHFQRRPMTAPGEQRTRGGVYPSRAYRDRVDSAPLLARAEREAILKQFFANLNMIQRQQELAIGRRSRRHEPRRRPGPYGEAK